MARLSQLIGAGLLALFGASAHAAYTSGRPPPGWQTMQSSPTGYGYAKAATEMWIDGKLVNSTLITTPAASKNLPVLQRIDPVAARRTAVSLLFTHPAMRSAAAVFAWLQIAKVVWDEASQQWKREVDSDGQGGVSTSDGFEYSHDLVQWFSSGSQACQAYASTPGLFGKNVKLTGTRFYLDRYNTPFCAITLVLTEDYNGSKAGETSTNHIGIHRRQGACPAGESPTPSGCAPTASAQPLTKEEFEQSLAPDLKDPTKTPIMPLEVLNHLPLGSPIPVQLPTINPSSDSPPVSRPYFIPTGDPVANPNYDPKQQTSPTNQPYIQPGIKLQPSPVISDPYRVDVQPVSRPQPTPDPNQPDPDPGTDPGDQPKPDGTQSLCEKHPDILACQKLDQPEAKELAKEDINITITPRGGWGAENAACPAPRAVQVAGRSVELSWQPVCDFASGLRPLVIALAWLSAVSMVIVVARRN